MFNNIISNTKSVASSFAAGMNKAVTSRYTSKDRAVLAAAGVTATVGVVAGPVVAAGVIVGAVMYGRAKR
jgi:uncharacterized membrane protein YccC